MNENKAANIEKIIAIKRKAGQAQAAAALLASCMYDIQERAGHYLTQEQLNAVDVALLISDVAQDIYNKLGELGEQIERAEA